MYWEMRWAGDVGSLLGSDIGMVSYIHTSTVICVSYVVRDVSIVSIDFENGSVVVCGFLLSKFIDARWGERRERWNWISVTLMTRINRLSHSFNGHKISDISNLCKNRGCSLSLLSIIFNLQSVHR